MTSDESFLHSLVDDGSLTPADAHAWAAQTAPGLPAGRHAEPGQWTPGAVLGSYRLERVLGRGGAGEVWLVTHVPTHTPRALKTVLGFVDPEAHARFLREAQALAQLDGHPHVLRVHEIGQEGSRVYMVLDLAQPADLAQRLRTESLTADQARSLLLALANGLAHVHAHGFLHRDLKPHNVLFADDGRPLVADFGLVRGPARSSLTFSGEVLGTPAYMAPEQALGTDVDERADVYGLGAILYQVLSGRAPFDGQTPISVLQKVLEAPPVPPSRIRKGVPPDLEAICLRALSKDPNDRHRSAREFAAALQGEGQAPSRMGVTLVASALLAVSSLLGAGYALSIRWDSPEPPPRQEPEPESPDTATSPPATTPAPPRWPNGGKAYAEGLALLKATHPVQARAPLEFAFADEDLPIKERVKAGIALVKALTYATDEDDLQSAIQNLERARSVREEAKRLVDLEAGSPEQSPNESVGGLAALLSGVGVSHEVYNDLEAHLVAAESRILSAQGHPRQALSVVENAPSETRGSTQLVLRQGECLRALNRLRDAEIAFAEFLQGKSYSQYLVVWTAYYNLLGDLQENAKQDAIALGITPYSDNWWFFKHALRVRNAFSNNRAQAEAKIKQMSRGSSQSADQHAILAHSHLSLGRFDEAARHCTAALEEDATNAVALQTQTELHLWAGRNEEALELSDRLIARYEGHSLAHVSRAEALQRLGRPLEAEQACRRALKIRHQLAKESMVLVVLSWALKARGANDELLELYDLMEQQDVGHLTLLARKGRKELQSEK